MESIFPGYIVDILCPPARIYEEFSTGRAGSTLEVDMYVPTKKYYGFYIDLKFDRTDSNARSHIQTLAGTDEFDASGVMTNNGIAIPLILYVGKIENNREIEISSTTIRQEHLEAYWSDTFEKRITGITLEAGHYHLILKELEDIEQLNGVPVYFSVKEGTRK